MNEVDVYCGHAQPVLNGRLDKNQDRHVFSYRHDAQDALSLTMPLRSESYHYHSLHPVFQMNLPEGALRDALERMTAKQYGSDDLTLLTILGQHQIGRIAYSPAGKALVAPPDKALTLEALLGNQDAGLFSDLLQRYAQSSGVAGVQPKVLVEIQERITLPAEHYIVKSWGDDYPQLACNEFVCMSIARDAGLTVPEFYLSDDARLLITKRFDIDANGEALGFEDFCVLSGKGTREKYDSSLEACTKIIRQFVSAQYLAQALYDFYKLTLLNVRLRNGDAHLKNSGVLYQDLAGYREGAMPQTLRRMAPVFDIVSTVPYLPRDTMALTLTGSKRWPKGKVLQAFGATHCQLSQGQMVRAAEEVERGVQNNLKLLEDLGNKHLGFADIGEKILEFLD